MTRLHNNLPVLIDICHRPNLVAGTSACHGSTMAIGWTGCVYSEDFEYQQHNTRHKSKSPSSRAGIDQLPFSARWLIISRRHFWLLILHPPSTRIPAIIFDSQFEPPSPTPSTSPIPFLLYSSTTPLILLYYSSINPSQLKTPTSTCLPQTHSVVWQFSGCSK